MATGIGRDEGMRERGGKGLRFVVAWRADQLHRTDNHPIEATGEQLALRHQQQAPEITLQRHSARRRDPTEATAINDRRIGGFAEGGEIVIGEIGDPLDGGNRGRGVGHGFHRRKLRRMRMPTAWLFSTWNCVPARLSLATMATTLPP